MKARQWLERSRLSDDPFDVFANAWRGFSNLFASIGNGDERHKIRMLLLDCISDEVADQILLSSDSGVAMLMSQPVIDMRGNGHDTAARIEAYRVAKSPLAKLQEVFMVIYQVRCNLEHGQKSPTRERDVALCQAAAPLVAAVVDRGTEQAGGV